VVTEILQEKKKKKMNFEIIPNQQTPRVPEMGDVKQFLIDHKEEWRSFVLFASHRRNAVGLAANQTSIDGERFMHRVFALMDIKDRTWRLIVNPAIEEYIGMKELKEEGCLTWVGKRIIAERSFAVRVSHYSIEGEKIIETYKGFEAQIWQHEINHLNGVEERIEELSFRLPKQNDIGRNEKCPCDSGKKFKQCCIGE
jgi:peptide deformylase